MVKYYFFLKSALHIPTTSLCAFWNRFPEFSYLTHMGLEWKMYITTSILPNTLACQVKPLNLPICNQVFTSMDWDNSSNFISPQSLLSLLSWPLENKLMNWSNQPFVSLVKLWNCLWIKVVCKMNCPTQGKSSRAPSRSLVYLTLYYVHRFERSDVGGHVSCSHEFIDLCIQQS